MIASLLFLASVSSAFSDYDTLNRSSINWDVPMMSTTEDPPPETHAPTNTMRPTPQPLPPFSNKTALFKYFGLEDYWKKLNISEEVLENFKMNRTRNMFQYYLKKFNMSEEELNKIDLNETRNSLVSLPEDVQEKFQRDLNRYLEKEFPKQYLSPSYKMTFWKWLLIVKIILGIIYCILRCQAGSDERREKDETECIEKPSDKECCKIP